MTTATATRELNEGDIIEIAQYNDRCALNLRRVRVKSLTKLSSLARAKDGYKITGVNMHGINPMDYALPSTPITKLTPRAGATMWRFTETTPGEE